MMQICYYEYGPVRTKYLEKGDCMSSYSPIDSEQQGSAATGVVQEASQLAHEELGAGVKKEPAILCRSQSCLMKVENQSEKTKKAFLSAHSIVACMLALPFVLPYLKAMLDGDIGDADIPGTTYWVVALIGIGIISIVLSKVLSNISNNLELYRRHCTNEVLIVDDEKVYGGNTKGKICIPLEKIASVRYRPKTSPIPGEEKLPVDNDIFEIRDIANNTYVFYSFANCGELHAVIDMQLRRRKQ